MLWRWRVRTLIIVVISIEIALGFAVLMNRRTEAFEELGRQNQWVQFRLTGEAFGVALLFMRHPSQKQFEAEIRNLATHNLLAYEASEYHGALSRKYYEAARQPWLSVVADLVPPPLNACLRAMSTETIYLVDP